MLCAIISPSLLERSLLVKFYCLKKYKASAIPRGFRKPKEMLKGNAAVSVTNLKAMVEKCENIGYLKDEENL